MPRAQPTFLVVYSWVAFLCVCMGQEVNPCDYMQGKHLYIKNSIHTIILMIYEQLSMRED